MDCSKEESWREELEAGDLVLVCDVGGGTHDFSLISISDKDGKLDLNRVSVGDHLLLGGDNMDMALAFKLKTEHEKESSKLDQWQFQSLVYQVKNAKEKLLSDEALDSVNISVSSRGSSLFASALSFKLEKADVENYLTNGFFPSVDQNSTVKQARKLGLQKLGLKYETDPAISKHVVEFLRKAKANLGSNEDEMVSLRVDGELLLPNKILFNGGVFKSKAIRKALLDSLGSICSGDLYELSGANYDLAVSRGASYFAKMSETGKGIKIKAGSSRSYYLGVESSEMAMPGFEPPVEGLCVVSMGTEEGTSHVVSESEFSLLTGETAHFRFFSSNERADDLVGAVVEDAEQMLEETASLTSVFQLEGANKGELVAVSIETEIDDLGQMKLYLKHKTSDKKWKLDFDLRAHEA